MTAIPILLRFLNVGKPLVVVAQRMHAQLVVLGPWCQFCQLQMGHAYIRMEREAETHLARGDQEATIVRVEAEHGVEYGSKGGRGESADDVAAYEQEAEADIIDLDGIDGIVYLRFGDVTVAVKPASGHGHSGGIGGRLDIVVAAYACEFGMLVESPLQHQEFIEVNEVVGIDPELVIEALIFGIADRVGLAQIAYAIDIIAFSKF